MAATGRRLLCLKSGVLLALDGRTTTTDFAEVAIPGTYGKNLLINGDFSVAQRGVQFNTPANVTPMWDGWYTETTFGGGGSAGSFTWERFRTFETFSLAGANWGIPHSTYFVQFFQGVAMTSGTAQVLRQWVEGTKRFSGIPVTISFVASAGASKTVVTRLLRYYGSGGTPSATDDLGNASHSITTSTQKFSHTITIPDLTGKTLGTNGDDGLVVRLEMPTSGTGAINFYDIQLEYGSTATAFEHLPPGEQLRRCQRYFCKTFNQSITPAQNTGSFAGALGGSIGTLSANAVVARWQFPVTMRTAPSITTYNPAAANTNWRNLTAGTDIAATIEAVGDAAGIVRTGGVTADSGANFLYIHAAAEAGIRV